MAGTTLAEAYIHLKANMTGVKGDIEKELGGVNTKSAGKKMGKSLGENTKIGLGSIAIGNALGNMLISGITAASQGITEVVGGALTNAMDYEQLAGGAQKIFDQMDFGKISADAQNAYKELNMSANEYLESINLVGATFAQTMGDEKGYDTARKGMLAISDYASGTGRNLDELNEKYQMITRATSSYQSIADQFSGILPATSKDFLEQAQAAGFLSTEYKKLTDVPVAEYQDAVTQMLEKGVAELGLAGNTANESFNTMSGSINMAKSSWENFLTAIGTGQDVELRLQELMTSVQAVATNIVPTLMTIGQSLITALGTAISEAGAYITANKEQVAADALNMFSGLVDGIITVAPGLITALVQLLFEIGAQILAHVPDILAKGLELITALASGIANGLVPTMDAINGVVQGALDAAGQFVDSMITAGANLINGLIQGIKDTIGGVGDIIVGGLSDAVGGVMNFLGIASPSKLFAQIGSYTMQGFAQGINKTAGTAANAMRNAAHSVYGAAQGSATFTASTSYGASSGISEAIKAELTGMGVYLDGRALVGGIAPQMDSALGGFA